MAKRQQRQGISTELSAAQFEKFVWPHLTVGKRGPASKRSLYKSFGDILNKLYVSSPYHRVSAA